MDAVLDANVFIRMESLSGFDAVYTVPAVREELESRAAELGWKASGVEVVEPSAEAVERVEGKAEEVGAETSDTDQSLLALALDLDATLVTDDKGLQNLALHLDQDFQAYMGDEVEEERSWTRVCANCGEEVPGRKCPSCGSTTVRRKPDQCSSG